jgi:hypothetical protein
MPPVRKSSGKVHEFAQCQECPWQNSNYKNALATAARHAEATGHEVIVEQRIVVIYNKKGVEGAG